MTKAHRLRKLSLRQVLIASLIFQALVAVGLTSYLSWRNGRRTVEALALELSREVSSHTEQHIQNYLNTPTTFLKINRVFTNNWRIDVSNLQDLQNVFWQQVQINPEIKTIYFGSQQGDFVEVEFKGLPKVSIRDRNSAPFWHTYSLDANGKLDQFIEKKKYDPRLRPWYHAALEHKDLVWSPIYLFADPPVLGITPAVPIVDPQSETITGVMAIDLTLKEISQFLNTLRIGDSGRAFIMEPSGAMVATSTTNSLVKKSLDGNQRIHYQDSQDNLIKATSTFLASQTNNFEERSNQQLIFEFEENRYFVQVTNLTGYPGLSWLMVTVIPESDFGEHIRKNTYTTLALSICALISAIILGVVANQLIVNSIAHISQLASKISQGQIQKISQQHRIREFAIVTESINTLAVQLQASNQSIESLEYKWEQRVEETTKNLQQVNQELSRLANVDSLTQIHNRYYFDLKLQQLWKTIAREKNYLGFILCDVDHFKFYNDTYGHLRGDKCLQKVAQAIEKSVHRHQDVVARYGGEEFAILLPYTDSTDALQIAERIRDEISKLNIPHRASKTSDRVTISCGVISIIPDVDLSAKKLIESADQALYQAKQKNRNCCILAKLVS